LDSLDVLLDQEGVEVDPRSRREGDTPLHSAARLSAEDGEEAGAEDIVKMLLEAGADPRYADSLRCIIDSRIRNKGGLKPIDIVSPGQTALKQVLKKAELRCVLGNDIVSGSSPATSALIIDDDDDEGGNSASDEE